MTAAAVIGLAWAVLVAAAACRYRPLPRRPLRQPDCAASHDPVPARWRGVDALGRAILRLRTDSCPGTATPAPARVTPRWVGCVAVAVIVSGAAVPVIVPAVVFVGWAWPRLSAHRGKRRQLARLEAGLPEIVDLLTLAVGAGANVTHAVAAAGRRGVGPLAAELSRVATEVGRGRRLADALDELPDRAGEAVRPLAVALASCDRYGAALGPALERLGDEVRRQRQRRAEESARKVPVVLLFPLVLCVLPAFALLTVAPLVAGALRALRL